MTWFQNSAEHEVQYARAHAMITDVIEASLELGWKGWKAISNAQAAHVAKTVDLSSDSMVLSNRGWRTRGPFTQSSAGGSRR